MKINEILDQEAYINIDEAHHTTELEYNRKWVEYTKEEREAHPEKGYGYWELEHRKNMGVNSDEPKIVHHKDGNKHNNSPDNLMLITRAEHCKIDPNARKHYGCKIKGCKNPHYAKGYCLKHYMEKFRDGKFGHYNPKNNKSRKDR